MKNNIEPSVASKAGKHAFILTLYGGMLAGSSIGLLFFTAFVLHTEETVFDTLKGLAMAVPGGTILGGIAGLMYSFFIAILNKVVVYGITWLVMNNNWPIVVYRWLLIILMTVTDVGLVLYLWYSTKENRVGNGFNNFLLLIAVLVGIAAIIASVLMSRWYSKMVALIHRDDDIIALGYNPEIYK